MTFDPLNNYLKQRVEPLKTMEKLVFISMTGFFVFLFLLFFQPFGVNNYDPEETITTQFFWVMAFMGAVVSIIIAINEFLIYRIFMSKRPSRRAFLIWIAWSIVWLSTGIFLFYNLLGNWHDFSWSSWLEFIGNMGILCLIPVTAIFVYIRIRDLNQTLHARELKLYSSDSGDMLINILAENEKDHFSIPLKYLVYVESQDNYIAVHYLKGGNLTKVLIRRSLKSLQEESIHPALLRCHRSIMVNLKHIREVRGNRKKLELTLENLEQMPRLRVIGMGELVPPRSSHSPRKAANGNATTAFGHSGQCPEWASCDLVPNEAAEPISRELLDRAAIERKMLSLRRNQTMVEGPCPWIPGVRLSDVFAAIKSVEDFFGPNTRVAWDPVIELE